MDFSQIEFSNQTITHFGDFQCRLLVGFVCQGLGAGVFGCEWFLTVCIPRKKDAGSKKRCQSQQDLSFDSMVDGWKYEAGECVTHRKLLKKSENRIARLNLLQQRNTIMQICKCFRFCGDVSDINFETVSRPVVDAIRLY